MSIVLTRPARTNYNVAIIAAVNNSPELVDIVVKSLAEHGMYQCTVTNVTDPMTLAFYAQNLAASADGILALGVVTSDGLGKGSVTELIATSLLHASVQTRVPMIPAIVEAWSLLEARGLIGEKCQGWSDALLKMLKVKMDKSALKTVSAPPVEGEVYAPIDATKQTTPEGLLAALRASLKKRGADGIYGIGRKFKILDDDHSESVEFPEFAKAIKEHSMGWSEEQVKLVFDAFDTDKSGHLNYQEFLKGCREPLNSRRIGVILLAFQTLDVDKSGVVEKGEILRCYEAKRHPDVVSGKMSEEEAVKLFAGSFEKEQDGKITVMEFIEYYQNLSISIDSDDYFELTVRNIWKVQGGEGWAKNTSAIRVLCEHEDGHNFVAELKGKIKGELTDELMLENLAKQDITGVISIVMYGCPSG